MFEEDFITVARDGSQTHQIKPGSLATVEELFMFLYFFKTQMRDLTEEEGMALIKQDYRVNLLVQMIFNQYEPSEIEFSY